MLMANESDLLQRLGAVLGAFLSTFLMLETFGNRYTLWLTVLVNALIALFAIAWSRPRKPPQ